MNIKILFLAISSLFLWSCANTEQPSEQAVDQSSPAVEFQNKAHELVYNMSQKVGDYQKLRELKDVVYTYSYQTPDTKEDISTEKYIFDGELSYASYHKHERTLPDLDGIIEQGYDGQHFWLKNQGEYLKDEAMMQRTTFSRKTNFYWFTMLQKLLDPGITYEYIEETNVNDKAYDVVKISFTSPTGKPTDIYQLYINKETSLVDQFLFTVADFNKLEIPFLMLVEYEKVDGFLIPTKRKYTAATWQGEVIDNDAWIFVNWTDIKFNNGLDKSIFEHKM